MGLQPSVPSTSQHAKEGRGRGSGQCKALKKETFCEQASHTGSFQLSKERKVAELLSPGCSGSIDCPHSGITEHTQHRRLQRPSHLCFYGSFSSPFLLPSLINERTKPLFWVNLSSSTSDKEIQSTVLQNSMHTTMKKNIQFSK